MFPEKLKVLVWVHTLVGTHKYFDSLVLEENSIDDMM